MDIPIGLVVAVVSLFGTGFLTWVAYVSKLLVEHARIMAELTIKHDVLEAKIDSSRRHPSYW